MPKSPNQKLKLLHIHRMLLENTDEGHPMKVSEIISELAKYDIEAERKTIYSDMEALKQYGVDILSVKSRSTGYYVASRDFDLAELKLLADAVASAKFITERKSDSLIKKIGRHASKHENKQLRRNIMIRNRVKTLNEHIYYNVDRINEAITDRKQIHFKYFDYDLDKNKVYRREGSLYTVSPYALFWDDENYYAIGFYEKYNRIAHFRIDRMEDVSVSDLEARREGDFDVASYAKKTFSMFTGEEEHVALRFTNNLINVVYDKFGKDIFIRKVDDEHFQINVPIAVSTAFYGWLFQLGPCAAILSPEHVRLGYLEQARKIIKLHEGAGQ